MATGGVDLWVNRVEGCRTQPGLGRKKGRVVGEDRNWSPQSLTGMEDFSENVLNARQDYRKPGERN